MRLQTVLHRGARLLVALVLYSIPTIAAPAQTYTILHNFQGTDGANPNTPLVQGFDGQFYGTTLYGGEVGYGILFKIGRYGKFTILHDFVNNPAGDSFPAYNLLENEGGTLYGTTYSGDGIPQQELYRMSETGDETVLLQFCTKPNCTDGNGSNSLSWDWNHNLIDSLSGGGADSHGVIFSVTPGGRETTIHTFFCFPNYCPYGAEPAQVIQASDGNLYGEAWHGGTANSGTVYTVGPSKPFTKLYDFCSQVYCADGVIPVQLVQGSDANLYGTTEFGGAYNSGTIFKMSTAGVLTTLYNFCGAPKCPDGNDPQGKLVEGSDGNFYGVNYQGGQYNHGTIFRFTPSGTFSVLYTFGSSGLDAYYPTSLVQGTDGAFYGTTAYGGNNGSGVVFRLEMGLGPFIQPVLTFGKIGAYVTLLGTNLTGATAVSFNGVPATIDVNTPYRIQTTVPAGATSGTITVTLPTGTLSSNMPFTVIP